MIPTAGSTSSPPRVADLRGIVRVGRALATGRLPIAQLRREFGRAPTAVAVAGVPRALPRQMLRFAAIGIVSTLAYLGLFSLLRHGLDAQTANLVALLVTAVANTAANRRLTFGISGRRDAAEHQLQGLFVFVLGLGLTSGSLAGLHAVAPSPPRTAELAVLVTANLAATVLRFVLLRLWLFHRRTA